MYTHVYMYVYIYVCMYVCMYVCVYRFLKLRATKREGIAFLRGALGLGSGFTHRPVPGYRLWRVRAVRL